MRAILGALFALGLALIGYAGALAMGWLETDALRKASTIEPDTGVAITDILYDARWIYDAETGFNGAITISSKNQPDAADVDDTDRAEGTINASFMIDYPTAFAGALSFHIIDQKLLQREHFDSRQISGLEYLSCFRMDSGLSLTSDRNLQTVLKDYRACRVTSTASAIPIHAVVGYLSPARNQQPIDKPAERCAAEANIWLERIALPETRYAICMIVIDEAQNSAELILFERLDGDLIVRSAKSMADGSKLSFRKNAARSSWNLTRFDLFQKWKQDEDTVNPAFISELPAIAELTKERAKVKDLAPSFAVEDVALFQKSIGITLRSLSDARVGDHTKRGLNVRNAVRDLLCSDPKLAAFLDLQQLDTVLGVTLISENGKVMMDGRHDETPCNTYREK